MSFKKLFLLGGLLFFSIVASFSQQINNESENLFLPKSIYSLNISTKDVSAFNIQNKLNIKQYKFIPLNVYNIEDGYFSIPLKNIKKPSDFIFETYKDKYAKRNLEKSFFDINKLYLPYTPNN